MYFCDDKLRYVMHSASKLKYSDVSTTQKEKKISIKDSG